MASAPREAVLITLSTLLLVVVIAVTVARLWTRRVLQKTFGMEDWLILLALVMAVGLFAGIILAVCLFHYGQHTWELSNRQRVNAAWWLFVAEIVYIFISALVKIAILLFYRRLADRKQGKGFFYALYAVMGEVIIYKTIYIILILLSCVPLQARWEKENPLWTSKHHYTCLSERLNILIGSTISATEDMVIALLPTLILWNLKMRLRQKFALWALFALSTATGICSYIRTYFIYRAYWGTGDYIHELYWLWVMSGIEVNIALLCASAPALKPFLNHFQIGQRFWAPLAKVTGAVGKFNTVTSARLSKFHPRSKDAEANTRSNFTRPAKDDEAVFDGSMTGGASATQSYVARATWDKPLETSTSETWRRRKDSLDASEGRVHSEVSENSNQSKGGTRPPMTDGMWISVRSSITIDQE